MFPKQPECISKLVPWAKRKDFVEWIHSVQYPIRKLRGKFGWWLFRSLIKTMVSRLLQESSQNIVILSEEPLKYQEQNLVA